MEFEEHRHKDCDNAIQHESYLNDDIRNQFVLVFILCAEVICVEWPLNWLQPGERHRNDHEVSYDQYIDQ